jgi:RNA polymerase sigma factor (sigma-70 family)
MRYDVPEDPVDTSSYLTEQFEQSRGHLRGVAYRMLGSLSEADDAVQEAWLRLERADTREVENLKGWLTTVVARVCLDMLRSRRSRREDAVGTQVPEPVVRDDSGNPEQEALLADSVGLALLVVLDTLAPPERIAFVLHDLFAVPFEEIATIVGRSVAATRQLASRARRRIQGAPALPDGELTRQRDVVTAFLTALRAGDFDALLEVLDPDVVIRADQPGAPGAPAEIRGARNWAKQAIVFARMAQAVQPALIDGVPGVILAPRGRLVRALRFTYSEGKISDVEIIASPETLSQLEVAMIDEA